MTILAAIIAASWLLALLRTLINLRAVPRLGAHDAASSSQRLSVVIPARNEGRVIGRTVRALLAQTYANFEVIVVNDRSTDDTGAVLKAIDDERLIVIDGHEPPPGWLGKPWALAQGSARARGTLLLFVDADVIYRDPTALASTVAHFESSGTAMLALLPNFELETIGERIAMPQLAMTIFCFFPLWLANRTAIAIIGIGGGPGNLIRRDVYESLGGHTALKDAVIDDVGLARLVRRSGRPTRIARADALITLRMYEGTREIVHGFTKNAFAAFSRSYLVAFTAVVLMLLFNVMPFVVALGVFHNGISTLEWLSIAAVLFITLTRLVLFVALRYGIVNALLFHLPMTAVWTWIVLRSIWRTGVRRQMEWRGRTYDAAQTKFGADR